MLWIACVKLVGELSDQNYNMPPHSSRLTPLKQRSLESYLLDTDQNWQIACVYVYLINLIYGKVASKN